jgi:hypothetical protein
LDYNKITFVSTRIGSTVSLKKVTTIEIEGKPYARLFLVVDKEPGYEKNLILAIQFIRLMKSPLPFAVVLLLRVRMKVKRYTTKIFQVMRC